MSKQRLAQLDEAAQDTFVPILLQAAAIRAERVGGGSISPLTIDVLVTHPAIPGTEVVEKHIADGKQATVFFAQKRGSKAHQTAIAYSNALTAVQESRAAAGLPPADMQCVWLNKRTSLSVKSLRASCPQLWNEYRPCKDVKRMLQADGEPRTAFVDAREEAHGRAQLWAHGGVFNFMPHRVSIEKGEEQGRALAAVLSEDGVERIVFSCANSNSRGPNAARFYRDHIARVSPDPAVRAQRLCILENGLYHCWYEKEDVPCPGDVHKAVMKEFADGVWQPSPIGLAYFRETEAK